MSKGVLRTKEEFINSSNIIHNNKYDYSKICYKNGYTDVEIVCPIHGRFLQTPKRHLNGYGCKKCGVIKNGLKHRKYNNITYFETARSRYDDSFDYSQSNFVTLGSKIQIRCKKHNIIFTQTACQHLLYRGCPECKKESLKLSQNEFIKRAHNIHGNKYDYSLVVYKGMTTKISIICNLHGRFLQNPADHLIGNGCPLCAATKRGVNSRLSQNEFLDKAYNIHGNKYNYSLTKYIDAYTKVTIICPIHGEYLQRPVYHLLGCGCSKCNASKGEVAIEKFLIRHNISFKEQYSFDECRHKARLRFDFYIPEWNTCIEFDGIQHRKPRKNWGGEGAFVLNLKRDTIKNEFCKNKGIVLIRLFNIETVDKDMGLLLAQKCN